MATLKINFVADWHEYLREALRTVWGSQADAIASRDLPSSFFDSFRRAIPQTGRRLMLSDVFCIPAGYEPVWEFLKAKVIDGGDLRPHLSGRHQLLSNSDGLLNDWGIHHFHLGISPKAGSPELVDRTGPIALAYVTDDAFYVIGVYPHRPAPWTKEELVEILHRNWPAAIARYRIYGVNGSPITEEQRTAVRNKHCAVFTKTQDGTVYAPLGGGVTASGVSIESVIQGDVWTDEIEKLQANCARQAASFFESLERVGKKPHGEIVGHLRITDDGYAIQFPAYDVLAAISWEKQPSE